MVAIEAHHGIFFEWIFRKFAELFIAAMFSDDTLFHQLTLKGGNALNLVYKFGSRASVDIDFSLDADFTDIDDARENIPRVAESPLLIYRRYSASI